mmetsp:Transcript_82823/g.121311  ORF Transcript_82823/g.121311 Transcript_82823/m.121311 type:complete len:136 (+) Transcript_82823:53-460(+)
MGGIPEVRLKPSTVRPQRWSIWYCAAAAVVHAGQLQAASSGTAVPGSRRIQGACSLDSSNTTTACSRSLFPGLRILRGGSDANTTRLMPYEQEIRSGEEYPATKYINWTGLQEIFEEGGEDDSNIDVDWQNFDEE